MTFLSARFSPDMLLSERRIVYKRFKEITGKIMAEFVSTDPKPHGTETRTLMNRIKAVDLHVGIGLLNKKPEHLNIEISSERDNGYHIGSAKDRDPLFSGLATKEIFAHDNYVAYETDLESLCLVIRRENKVTDQGANHADFLTGHLMGKVFFSHEHWGWQKK